jgi:hypothetical protein
MGKFNLDLPFDVGDEVYFLSGNEIHISTVKEIKFNVVNNGVRKLAFFVEGMTYALKDVFTSKDELLSFLREKEVIDKRQKKVAPPTPIAIKRRMMLEEDDDDDFIPRPAKKKPFTPTPPYKDEDEGEPLKVIDGSKITLVEQLPSDDNKSHDELS